MWKDGDSMTYKVAICEDNETDSGYVAELLSAWARERRIAAYQSNLLDCIQLYIFC